MSVRSQFALSKDVDEQFLVEGREEDEQVIEIKAEGPTAGWKSHSVWRFEIIDGDRWHTRRAVVKNGERRVEVRMVYSHQP